MLREIDLSILLNDLEEDVLIIQNDTCYTLDEFFDGARILIEENPECIDEFELEDPEEEDDEGDEIPFPEVLEEELDPVVPSDDPEPEEERAPGLVGRKSSKDEILRAWDGGNRTVEEVIRLTGKTRQTVLKYLPKGAK